MRNKAWFEINLSILKINILSPLCLLVAILSMIGDFRIWAKECKERLSNGNGFFR